MPAEGGPFRAGGGCVAWLPGTAATKLRAAIESAAGDDDESPAEALAALESDVAEERAVQHVKARWDEPN